MVVRMRLGMFVESDIGLRALYCPQIIRIKGLGRHGLGLSIQVYAWFSNDVRICAQHECRSWSQMKELDFWWLQGLPSIRPPFHLWLFCLMQSIWVKLEVFLFPSNFELLCFHVFMILLNLGSQVCTIYDTR